MASEKAKAAVPRCLIMSTKSTVKDEKGDFGAGDFIGQHIIGNQDSVTMMPIIATFVVEGQKPSPRNYSQNRNISRTLRFGGLLILILLHCCESFVSGRVRNPSIARAPFRRVTIPSTSLQSSLSTDPPPEAIETKNGDLGQLFHALATQWFSPFQLTKVAALRQRFHAGQRPVIVSFRRHLPSRWLNRAAQLMINGTALEESFHSLERLCHWPTAEDKPASYTVEFLAEIKSIKRPAFLQILQDRRLWATGFALGPASHVSSVDCTTGTLDRMCNSKLKWPNELQALDMDTVLVSDGFLVPTKDKGGLYILHKGHTVCITDQTERWFYHRAVWIEHPDGSVSVLSARCRMDVASGGASTKGQLVWLNAPDEFQRRDFDNNSGPWDLRVLTEGPDVMFALADMDPNDDTIEVIASEFFSKRITLHSIRKGKDPRLVFSRVIDESVGHAFGCILANLHDTMQHSSVVLNSGSTVDHLKRGDSFSDLLVTSHSCSSDASLTGDGSSRGGGSLFSYKVPQDWRNDPWERSVVASGFNVKVKLSNIINPGAPGLVYTFQPHRNCRGKQPWIAVAGDCAESAYIFRPDPNGGYQLFLEVQCEATVGSIAIGYQEDSGYAKFYIPCHEQDKVLVFGLGNTMPPL